MESSWFQRRAGWSLATANAAVARAVVCPFCSIDGARSPAPGWFLSQVESWTPLDRLCRDRLAGFKRPRVYRVIAADDLPTTPTGKVQKFRLIERAAESADEDS